MAHSDALENFQPSRQALSRQRETRIYRTLYKKDTKNLESFGELARELLPEITDGREKKLYNIRKSSTETTHETDVEEMSVLIDSINTSKICGTLHDVACGTGTIIREMQSACENVTLGSDLRGGTTMDPINVSDFLNPANYREVCRPDWIVVRCARSLFIVKMRMCTSKRFS